MYFLQPSTAVVLLVLGCLVYTLLTYGHRPKGMPPGPPTLPILGNLHQLPAENVHVKFKEWADEYGDMCTVMLGNRPMIIITSPRVIKDLLDGRSNIYSSRPTSYIGGELIGGNMRLVFMKYDDEWRTVRKLAHKLLNIKSAVDYIPFQELELRQMLADMVKEPNAYHDHVRRYTTSLVTSFIFGWRSPSFHDPDVMQIYDGFEDFAVASNVSASMMDYFPILQKIPDWLSPIKRRAKELHKKELALNMNFLSRAKDLIAKGGAPQNFIHDLLKMQKKIGFSDEWASYVSGAFTEAGSDTTAGVFMAFAVAMINFPDVQKKAQEEIDRVVGPDRLPNMDDEPKLQYIRAIVKESLRWLPPSILGIAPHCTTADDTYRGFTIPKNTSMTINVWGLNNNAERYPDPRKFDPDRYKDDFLRAAESFNHPDPYQRDHFTFGAGRRVCQGNNIAERSLFLGIAYLLWTFNFEHALDENDNPIPISNDAVTQGIVCRPAPFPLKLVERDAARSKMVAKGWDNCKDLLSRYPEGIRSASYASDWFAFKATENLK